jgi:hypothetical protein
VRFRASFAAYAGLGLVKYVAGYAALLATGWSPDFTALTNVLLHNVAASDKEDSDPRGHPVLGGIGVSGGDRSGI